MVNEKLLSELEIVFPVVDKPDGITLSYHKDDCFQCSYLRKALASHNERSLAVEAIRIVCQDMSCLSARGWRWVLPSYIKFCLTQPAGYEQLETEFLIYNLAPSEEHEKETRERLSGLTPEQLQYLVNFLNWCKTHEHWGKYCEEEILSGIKYLSAMLA